MIGLFCSLRDVGWLDVDLILVGLSGFMFVGGYGFLILLVCVWLVLLLFCWGWTCFDCCLFVDIVCTFDCCSGFGVWVLWNLLVGGLFGVMFVIVVFGVRVGFGFVLGGLLYCTWWM